MKQSRSEYVAKNVTVTIVMQIIKNLLGFVSRTIFVNVLGAEYLGVNGLFTDILTVLSFAELGIGNAMIFSLYKPLAEDNKGKINSLMKLYARSYQIIGIVIAVIGLCIIPFLNKIVGDVSYVKEDITLLYVLFLFNSVVSYFFVYKKSLIIADQKNYIVDIYQQVFYAIQVLVQSVFLIITKEFITYLIIVIACTILNNYFVARKANKMYPYLKDKKAEKLPKKEIKDIIKNIKALIVYKVGNIILESTDSIFISSLINVVTVGLYSNYKIVVNIFKTIGSQVMNSVVASVGNLNASGTDEKKESVFYDILYLNAWFFGFTSVGLCLFLSDFVTIWLSDNYIISVSAVVAACVYFYVSNMHYPCFTYRTTAGLFVFGKYVPLIASIINIILDIVMGIYFGLPGILWASTISRLVTFEIVDPFLVYKRIFNKSPLMYFVTYGKYVVLILLNAVISYFVINLIDIGGITGFLIKVIVFAILFNAIFFLTTIRSKEFKSVFKRIKGLAVKNRKY